MSSKYFRLLQILRNIICECFPLLWIHRRIVRNLHHAVKISWNVQLYLKYRCHFLLQHCSGWKGKKRLSTLFKAWCTQQYSTVYLLRWWGWSSCPLSPWKASPSPWSVMGLLNLGQLTSSSHFPLPSRASQSTHNSCCFFARVSHSASMHSSSLYTFLFMAELLACKSEPAILCLPQSSTRSSPKLAVLMASHRFDADEATARPSSGVSSCKQRWFCGALWNDGISVLAWLFASASVSDDFPFFSDFLLSFKWAPIKNPVLLGFACRGKPLI